MVATREHQKGETATASTACHWNRHLGSLAVGDIANVNAALLRLPTVIEAHKQIGETTVCDNLNWDSQTVRFDLSSK